jgi:anhydro-N-acetylmuramic acid kinase
MMGKLALGLMSGTSMDGIDVAVIDVNSHQLVFGNTFVYSKLVSDALLKVMSGQAFDMHFFANLHHQIGQEFAEAAYQALNALSSAERAEVVVIGHHGQTVCHQTNTQSTYTWQMGCPHRIQERCQLPVVFDFRTKNVVQGGQGAPLAPLYHQQLFASHKSCAVINIGGISNISFLNLGQMARGYDIGPGNCLMDAWTAKHLGQSFDANGHWAGSGQVNTSLLENLLKDAYFALPTPKSIGKEYFSLNWLENYCLESLKPQDIQATLLHLSASSIANEVKRNLKNDSTIYLCGGGVKNHLLIETLKTLLFDYKVLVTDEVGVPADYLEAMMMAWLGWMRLQNHEFDVSGMMGGKGKQLLGMVCV